MIFLFSDNRKFVKNKMMTSKRIKIILFCFSMLIIVGFSIFLLLSFTTENVAQTKKNTTIDYTKYGSILLTIVGKRADNIDFTNSSLFKFVPIEKSDYKNQNILVKEGNTLSFYALRFLYLPGDTRQESNISFRLKVIDANLPTQKLVMDRVNINEFAIVNEDLKYFFLNDSFNTDSVNDGVTNFKISNYNFNEKTGKLQFVFSFNVDGENNETGNDMAIIGNVDVVVL